MSGGRLPENVARFAATLRTAGVKGSPAMTLAALDAVRAVGLDRREDVRSALRATLLTRHEDEPVFDEAFANFWRARNLDERLIAILSPKAPPKAATEPPRPGSRRVADALTEHRSERAAPQARPEIEVDARATSSSDELLRHRDFAQMSAADLASARRAIAALRVPDDERPSRRFAASPRGRFDPRRAHRSAVRTGGDLLLPAFRRPRKRVPPIVILADISGSMGRYSEMILRFAHALSEHRRHVSTFLFGTRLTNVSRALRHRDPDEAIAACGLAAEDWSGGTRIGDALARFNRDWSRRVLGQGATLLLVTDGLERGGLEELDHEAERLSLSCRRLVWLSPLLGYEGFAAKAGGVRTLLPHVDEFRPVHSIAAIEELCRALAGSHMGTHEPKRWLGE